MQTNVAGVQFYPAGKIYDFSYRNVVLQVGDAVLVDGAKGQAVARVAVLKYEYISSSSLRSVIRVAGQRDLDVGEYPGDEKAKELVSQVVKQLSLKMEVVACRLQLGARKVVVFFVSPGRIDFRDLVKKLAGELRSRIELRQIGARDQTKLSGGVGICGRQYCCSTFLREFVPVSIKMAKNQNLALNPSQISGGCGRLRCCVAYENDMYVAARALLPPMGALVEIVAEQVSGVVSHLDILNEMITVKTEIGYRTCALEGLKVLSRKGKKKDGRKGKDKGERKPVAPVANESWGEDLDLEALMTFQDSTDTKIRTKSRD